MKKQWFFDRYCSQQLAALLENGKLTEFIAESESGAGVVGNIYKGKITNVLSGMQAAFVNCGLEKNGYLPLVDSYENTSKYDGVVKESNLSDVKVGDEVLVQVVKAPRGNKGAKLSLHLSFVGKNIIYLPNTEFLGISRKIENEQDRARLTAEVEGMRENPLEGFIIRTNALTATKKAMKHETVYLKSLYKKMLKDAKNSDCGTLLYRDEELAVRLMRDSIGDDVEIEVGDKQLYNELLDLARLRGDFPEKKIKLYSGQKAMMHDVGIYTLLQEAVRPEISLPSGGDLVIEHTEAMTVVDVNTGSFVGDTSLEDTVFAVNMSAAEEIARQVRLRNVGGLVVVDFIDMTKDEHRKAVKEKLVECLKADKAKCKVLEMSEFCLVEFTRKRVGSEVKSYLVKPCETCNGRGYVPSDLFTVMGIRAEILNKFADGYTSAVVEMNEKIMKKILSEGLLTKEVNGIWKDKRIYMVPHKTFQSTQYSVKGDTADVLDLPDKAQILY